MALSSLRHVLVLLGALILLVTPSAIYSCGPFLESAIFAFDDRPDGPAENFAVGRLGIVRPEFRQAYLVVAYRYLSGLKLSNQQQKAALDVWDRNVVPEHPGEDEAIAGWNKARNKIPNLPAALPISPDAVVSKDQPYFQYVNCPGDAFQNAIRTLDDRTAKFGPATEKLRDWVSGQDQVFANCGGEVHVIPAVLNSGDPLLRADRVYQIAAAHFYARDFDEATAEFDTIAQDRSSPWAGVSSYLAARALIRKANLVHKENEPFDRTAMSEAQKRLETIVADPQASSIHDAATKLLNFVRFRTEPEKRVAELDRIIMQPELGKNFKQDLWDYAVLLSHGEQGEDPSEWLQTFHNLRSNYPPLLLPQAAKDCLARWQETKSLPWLIAALAASDSHTPNLQSLLAAARAIPRSSSGYLTVRYYALRLMIASGESDAARKELDVMLKNEEPDLPLGSRNLLNEQRLKVTSSLEDFLQHAPETPVPSEVDFNTGEEVPAESTESQTSAPLFNHYAAEVLVKRLPLAVLIQAVESPALPKHLRRELARTTWVRSVLIDDVNSAGRLQAVLQELDTPLWKAMESLRSATDTVEKHFAAVFIILNNPGMKPSVREGSLRTATLGELDNYRDNWWCTNMNAGPNWGQSYEEYNKDVNLKFVDRDPNFPFPGWLTDTQSAAANSEWEKLSTSGTAPNYLTNQVLAYAKQHPQDPRVPQALHLAIRSTRFGCTNAETSRLSKTAFDFLHERYPQSEWTAKTKYYY
ncbi:MAG: hypothetical protein ABSE28_23370 [Candidatus Sulfotelmatobacter sp.]